MLIVWWSAFLLADSLNSAIPADKIRHAAAAFPDNRDRSAPEFVAKFNGT
jgi:hypothetical protein